MLGQLGILAHAFPPSRARSWAFATFAAGAPVGAAFGAALGGVLTEKTSYVFLTFSLVRFERPLILNTPFLPSLS